MKNRGVGLQDLRKGNIQLKSVEKKSYLEATLNVTDDATFFWRVGLITQSKREVYFWNTDVHDANAMWYITFLHMQHSVMFSQVM